MRSFPWDSLVVSMGDDGFPIYDRDYMASDLREVYETFFSNGVFLDTEDALQVTAGEGMTVHVAPGKCCINGTVGYEKSIRELALQASSSQDRIDTVVLRWNANVEMRNIDLYVKTGVAAATPVAPTLTRSETVYELGLADIFVTKNSGAVSASRITDIRMNTSRCGIVTPLVKINMTSFYEQMNQALAELEARLEEQTQIAVELSQSALDGTTAGYLQNQITENLDFLSQVENIEYDFISNNGVVSRIDDSSFARVGNLVIISGVLTIIGKSPSVTTGVAFVESLPIGATHANVPIGALDSATWPSVRITAIDGKLYVYSNTTSAHAPFTISYICKSQSNEMA